MNRRRLGLVPLNVDAVLVIAGALYDLIVPSVPANHLTYLGATNRLDPRYAELDLAMLRCIGGCLLGVGITTILILANGPVRRDERWSLLVAALLVGVA